MSCCGISLWPYLLIQPRPGTSRAKLDPTGAVEGWACGGETGIELVIARGMLSKMSVALGCIHFLAMMNNAAVNIGVQMSTQVPAADSLGPVPSRGAAGSCGNSVFNFGGATTLFLHSGRPHFASPRPPPRR